MCVHKRSPVSGICWQSFITPGEIRDASQLQSVPLKKKKKKKKKPETDWKMKKRVNLNQNSQEWAENK